MYTYSVKSKNIVFLCARPELVEGFSWSAQRYILLPQFSFHSKPGPPSEGTEDGVKQAQDERGRDKN
jgi:hypothetical protein